jgi:predicted aconitase
MYLTSEEERVYDGEEGWAYQTAMRILVKLGDLFGAKRLIPITSAHISGVSYKTVGDAPIEFLEALFNAGAESKVESTVNPAGFDLSYMKEFRLPQSFQEKQIRILKLYEGMRINPVLTCTPYYIKKPRPETHLAWAESSAVVYANSLLNAWTNREGGPSALAAALIGKTPDYGLHRPENRKANVVVKVEATPTNEAEFGALGAFLGKVLKDKTPIIEGLPSNEEALLKQMGAAMASTGMTTIFYTSFPRSQEYERLETLSVERRELDEMIDSFSTTDEEPQLVFIGCPHCSFNELKKIAQQIKNKKIKDGIKFWICTSRHIRRRLENT